MKNFLKVILRVLGFITTVLGILTVLDKFTNKNRIENDYLDCTKTEENLSSEE